MFIISYFKNADSGYDSDEESVNYSGSSSESSPVKPKKIEKKVTDGSSKVKNQCM